MDNSNLISNLSYTNKDFQSIYPELLDTVKKISNRWDPSQSNESDPGVVLLKLCAIIADKCNYNIDKNILECFPVSVTQDTNARELFAQLGYYMHWNVAASGEVSLSWIGDKTAYYYQLPMFTMITDDENSIVYTIVEVPTISGNREISSFKILQGQAQKLLVNGESIITVENLDSQNRLYFASSNVAENGIFIKSDLYDYSDWQKVDNLEVLDLGKPVYRFGISQEGICYLEFPADIDKLIGSGLEITYIYTDGADGNIPSRFLTKLFTSTSATYYNEDGDSESVSLDDTNLRITNINPITNGQNKENIDDAYSGYQKTVGTFNTLVTLRDYNNAIRTAKLNNTNIVANGFVCDRTNDIQSSYKVLVDYEGTDEKEIYVERDSSNNDSISAFGLKMYVLENINSPSDISVASNKSRGSRFYNKTFDLLDNNDSYTSYKLKLIEDYLDEKKTIQHDFISILDDKICLIKNKYPIKCKIIPQYALSEEQAADISANILNNIYNRLNSKEIEFGQEINYDLLYDIIQNADERIKAIMLDNIEYTTYAVYHDSETDTYKEINVSDFNPNNYIAAYKNGDKFYRVKVPQSDAIISDSELADKVIVDLNTGHCYKKTTNKVIKDLQAEFQSEIFTKAVLAGVTPLFKSDNIFKHRINNLFNSQFDNIKNITTGTNIRIASNGGEAAEYTLRDNESIDFYAPSLIDKTNYSSYTKYQYCLYKTVAANSDYKLQDGESITFYWKDTDDDNASYQCRKYGSGTILRPNFELSETLSYLGKESNSGFGENYNSDVYNIYYGKDIQISETAIACPNSPSVAKIVNNDFILSSTKSITIRDKVETTIQNPYKCFWILNDKKDADTDPYYVLFESTTEKEQEYILQSGEYFIYCDAQETALEILSSGTRIRRTTLGSRMGEMRCDVIDIDSVNNNNIDILNKYFKNISKYEQITLTEMQILTIPSGATVRLSVNKWTTDNSISNDDSLIDIRGIEISGNGVGPTKDLSSGNSGLNLNANSGQIAFNRAYKSDIQWNPDKTLNSDGDSEDTYIDNIYSDLGVTYSKYPDLTDDLDGNLDIGALALKNNINFKEDELVGVTPNNSPYGNYAAKENFVNVESYSIPEFESDTFYKADTQTVYTVKYKSGDYDYQAVIYDAVSKSFFLKAAVYERLRNDKIESEQITEYKPTNKYQQYISEYINKTSLDKIDSTISNAAKIDKLETAAIYEYVRNEKILVQNLFSQSTQQSDEYISKNIYCTVIASDFNVSYTLLKDKPLDWDRNYSNYYWIKPCHASNPYFYKDVVWEEDSNAIYAKDLDNDDYKTKFRSYWMIDKDSNNNSEYLALGIKISENDVLPDLRFLSNGQPEDAIIDGPNKNTLVVDGSNSESGNPLKEYFDAEQIGTDVKNTIDFYNTYKYLLNNKPDDVRWYEICGINNSNNRLPVNTAHAYNPTYWPNGYTWTNETIGEVIPNLDNYIRISGTEKNPFMCQLLPYKKDLFCKWYYVDDLSKTNLNDFHSSERTDYAYFYTKEVPKLLEEIDYNSIDTVVGSNWIPINMDDKTFNTYLDEAKKDENGWTTTRRTVSYGGKLIHYEDTIIRHINTNGDIKYIFPKYQRSVVIVSDDEHSNKRTVLYYQCIPKSAKVTAQIVWDICDFTPSNFIEVVGEVSPMIGNVCLIPKRGLHAVNTTYSSSGDARYFEVTKDFLVRSWRQVVEFVDDNGALLDREIKPKRKSVKPNEVTPVINKIKPSIKKNSKGIDIIGRCYSKFEENIWLEDAYPVSGVQNEKILNSYGEEPDLASAANYAHCVNNSYAPNFIWAEDPDYSGSNFIETISGANITPDNLGIKAESVGQEVYNPNYISGATWEVMSEAPAGITLNSKEVYIYYAQSEDNKQMPPDYYLDRNFISDVKYAFRYENYDIDNTKNASEPVGTWFQKVYTYGMCWTSILQPIVKSWTSYKTDIYRSWSSKYEYSGKSWTATHVNTVRGWRVQSAPFDVSFTNNGFEVASPKGFTLNNFKVESRIDSKSDFESLPEINVDDGWRTKSSLQLNISNNDPMVLYDGQYMELYNDDGNIKQPFKKLSPKYSFQSKLYSKSRYNADQVVAAATNISINATPDIFYNSGKYNTKLNIVGYDGLTVIDRKNKAKYICKETHAWKAVTVSDIDVNTAESIDKLLQGSDGSIYPSKYYKIKDIYNDSIAPIFSDLAVYREDSESGYVLVNTEPVDWEKSFGNYYILYLNIPESDNLFAKYVIDGATESQYYWKSVKCYTWEKYLYDEASDSTINYVEIKDGALSSLNDYRTYKDNQNIVIHILDFINLVSYQQLSGLVTAQNKVYFSTFKKISDIDKLTFIDGEQVAPTWDNLAGTYKGIYEYSGVYRKVNNSLSTDIGTNYESLTTEPDNLNDYYTCVTFESYANDLFIESDYGLQLDGGIKLDVMRSTVSGQKIPLKLYAYYLADYFDYNGDTADYFDDQILINGEDVEIKLNPTNEEKIDIKSKNKDLIFRIYQRNSIETIYASINKITTINDPSIVLVEGEDYTWEYVADDQDIKIYGMGNMENINFGEDGISVYVSWYDRNYISIPVKLPVGSYVLPVYYKSNRDISIKLKIGDEYLHKFDQEDRTELIPGINYLALKYSPQLNIKSDAQFLSVELNNSIDSSTALSGYILLKPAFKYLIDYSDSRSDGYKMTKDFFKNIITRISNMNMPDSIRFNYAHEVSSDVKINNPLLAKSFNDKNHPYNEFTICQLDTNTIDNIADDTESTIIITNISK